MATLDDSIAWVTVRDQWRAQIGRLPRGHEDRLRRMVQTHGVARLLRAIRTTSQTDRRRTAERWAFFLALSGEAP